jgi:hypothetical protein
MQQIRIDTSSFFCTQMGEILKDSNGRVLQIFTRETLNRVKTSPCCLLTESVVDGHDSFSIVDNK